LHFDITFKPVSHPLGAGRAQLKLEIEPRVACEEITITVDSLEGVVYDGPSEWVAQVEKNRTYSVVLDVTIPHNDTSHISIEIIGVNERGWVTGWASNYFVTTGDSVEVYYGDPRYVREHPVQKAPKKRITKYSEDQLKPGETRPGTLRQMVMDKDGNLVPIDSVEEDTSRSAEMRPGPNGETMLYKWDKDGNLICLGPSTKARRDSVTGRSGNDSLSGMELLREMEKTPCTGVTGQRVFIGDDVWVRREGEYKFHKAEPIKDIDAYFEEKRRKHPKKKLEKRHVTMDLRKVEDYEFVRERVDSLMETEREGFYHAEVSKSVYHELRKRGIPWKPYPGYPDKAKKGQGGNVTESRESGSSDESDPPRDTLFLHDFESGWYGWVVGDSDTASGLDYWGRSQPNYVSPTWSAWCAEVGEREEPSYDNDMNAYMYTSTAIDMTEHTDVVFRYRFYCNTEEWSDYFSEFWSEDGEDWNLALDTCGFIDWTEVRWELVGPTLETYYIKFLFFSDASGCEWYEGVGNSTA
jgi:hypothetical protein